MAQLALFNVVDGRRLTELKTYNDFGIWTDMIPGDFSGSHYGYTDLLFYNSNTGSAAFYACDEDGNLDELRTINNGWRKGLKVLPGQFNGNTLTDLIFYDPQTGNVALYENTGDALMAEVKVLQGAMDKGLTHVTSKVGLFAYDKDSGAVTHYTQPWNGFEVEEVEIEPRNWRKDWSHMIPVDFMSDRSPELLFYDEKTGDAEFFLYDEGRLTSVKQLPGGWKKGLTHIVPAHLHHWRYQDLLFYHRNEGSGAIYWHQEEAHFAEAMKIQPGGWRKTWDAIAPGRFSNYHGIGFDYEHQTDLAFYTAESVN